MEILIQCTEFAHILFDKCQTMLLLVKLFPDTINQKNGVGIHSSRISNILYFDQVNFFVGNAVHIIIFIGWIRCIFHISKNARRRIGACCFAIESKFDPVSPFRNTFESMYRVLCDCTTAQWHLGGWQVCLFTMILYIHFGILWLIQVLMSRWEKLFQITDQIGGALQWSISPFFQSVSHSSSGTNSLESLYQALQLGFQHRNHYSTTELAYITVVVFLRCIVEYYELLRNSSTFGNTYITDL